jgi:hypothetical protein
MTRRRKCIVCSEVTSAPRPNKRSSSCTLDEQLTVIYFLKKFFSFPILPENIQACRDDESSQSSKSSHQQEILQLMLQTEGNPSTWFSFCCKCLEWVSEARELHLQLLMLERKLVELRSNVETRLWDSYEYEALGDYKSERETIKVILDDNYERVEGFSRKIRRNIRENIAMKSMFPFEIFEYMLHGLYK